MKSFALVLFSAVSMTAMAGMPSSNPQHALTFVVLGDAGNRGGILRGNASLVDAMMTGENDGGVPSVLIFLGSDFGETGLNVPSSEVDGEFNATLGFFKSTLQRLGRDNVHGIPGETEYFSQKAIETTALFGLIALSKWPVGVSDRGVLRAAERPEWRYHGHFPSSVAFPASDGTPDSVQVVFMDTGLLLRTRPETWSPVLDSLRRLLLESKTHPGFQWHLLCTHHPLVSYGEHGGFTQWNDEDSTVESITGCDKDTNAYRFVRNWLDPEDLCTDRYRAYIDSTESIVRAAGINVQLQLSSHDESLQLIDRNGTAGVPHVQIVSGCGSEAGLARIGPYSAARKEGHGISLSGLTQVRWQDGSILVTFFNQRTGDRIDMGRGATSFRIDKAGNLYPLRDSH